MSSYLSKHSDYNLKMMLKLNKQFNHIHLSDHSEGDTVALAATALGAKVIEKHVKLKEIIKVMIQSFPWIQKN